MGTDGTCGTDGNPMSPIGPISPMTFSSTLLQIPFRPPRKRCRHFHRLGRDLFAQDVLEDRAVDVFDLHHRMGGHDLMDAALVADVPAFTPLVHAVSADSTR